jgi:carbon storage regulator
MLVLSRKLDESIIIGHEITVTVLEVRGNRIRLGIEAPQQVPVRRRELSPIENRLVHAE